LKNGEQEILLRGKKSIRQCSKLAAKRQVEFFTTSVDKIVRNAGEVEQAP